MMQLTIYTLSLALSFLSLTLAAPALDSATLIRNGQDAQTLNAEFQQLRATNACNTGQMACINGSFALCQFGSWKLQPCTDSRKCFAVPSVTSNGTQLVCTSEANALSLINAAGAQGEVASSKNGTIAFPTTSIANSPQASSVATNVTSATSSASEDGIAVVTVTVTVGPTSTPAPTLTLPPETRTLNESDVLSLVLSIQAEGYSIVTSVESESSATATPGSVSASVSATPATKPGGYQRVVHPAYWRRERREVPLPTSGVVADGRRGVRRV
ncbi:unnamed protein product [Somion occarium]|uniref:Carbohydrate-binding module family 19 domain-containing protein n=1 Tax=Somion occarium TaxID=3059160 RepID=A0ABP1DLB0_9APHY